MWGYNGGVMRDDSCFPRGAVLEDFPFVLAHACTQALWRARTRLVQPRPFGSLDDPKNTQA